MVNFPNDTVKAIMERRSVRKFKPQQITEQELGCAIECGLRAPSARNTQNWHFTVIQNASMISWMNSEIIKNMPPEAIALYKDRQGGREDFSMFYDAPTLILVSGEKDDDYTDSNCGYATQNICIAAQSLGVASIVIGMARFIFATPDADEYAKKLGVPDGYKPLYVICLGYAGTQPDAPKLIEGKVSYIR